MTPRKASRLLDKIEDAKTSINNAVSIEVRLAKNELVYILNLIHEDFHGELTS